MATKIIVDLPFAWCKKCKYLDIKTEKLFANYDIYETRHYCDNERICRACERARQEEADEEED